MGRAPRFHQERGGSGRAGLSGCGDRRVPVRRDQAGSRRSSSRRCNRRGYAHRQREAGLRGGQPYDRLDGRPALVVDDGLASGYTMRAALQFLKGQGAGRLIVAVPTGSERTVWDLLPLVDELICLNVRGGFSFAVADAYENWYDLTEDEVLTILASLKNGK